MVRRNSKITRQQKKIRDAFVSERTVEIIPAKREFTDVKTKKLRVAAYCRVSTFDESQSGSFELQKQTYTERINSNPDWIMAGIYADQGASGTSIKRPEQFQQMLHDCRCGKIDLIIVKSVSRFARNQLDFISIYRELKALSPPVGIYIEDINLNTLDTNSEFILGIMAIVAQGESEQKSASITWSVIERFKDETEAKIVRLIYDSYIEGMTASEIASTLMTNHIPTVTGLERWTSLAVYNILRNEKYKGEIIMQKTYTVDCFSHKTRKNNGEKPKYRLKNGIPSIIPESRWDLVQELLKQPRRKSKSTSEIFVPKLYIKKLKSGKLRDFVVLDPSWKSEDIHEVFK